MGIILGIVFKAFLLSLFLTAVGLVIAMAVRGDSHLGGISFGIGLILFFLLIWQDSLLFGGLWLKGYEDRLVSQGEAFLSDLETATHALPLPSDLREVITAEDLNVSGSATVGAVRQATNLYIYKRIAWISFLIIIFTILMCVLKEDSPRRKKTATVGYGHYRPTEDF